MGTQELTPAAPLRLRNLPLSARLVLSVFLISVGCGYLAALVQLHMQHAGPGKALPDRNDIIRTFYGPVGEKPKPKLQQLLEADESLPWNGTGSMAAAFTTKSPKWEKAISAKAAAAARRSMPEETALAQAEVALREERDTERLALLDWIKNGHDPEAYEKDSYCLPESLAKSPIVKTYLVTGDDDKVAEPRAVKLQSIITERCARCHSGDGKTGAARIDLTKYEGLEKYLKVNESQAISKEALIQTTHVHLLSFSMLYLLTGIIFAFTSLPAFVRFVIAPLPLLAQLADVGCWWLTRLDPRFADGIIISGGVVGAGLILHIGLSMFDMYGKVGKAVLLLLIVAAGLGAWQLKPTVEEYLRNEAQPTQGQAAAPAQSPAPAQN